MTRPPLRVGLVIGQLSTGGAEGQLRLACAGFDRAVVTPTVYCLSAQVDPYGPLLERAGVAVRVLRGGRLGRVAALRRALVADRIDVVHAWLFIANAFAWAATRGGRLPLVTSARNCKRSGRALDWLNRRAFAASAAIVVNSAQVRDYIAESYAAPRPRIAIVYNAIDLTRFRPRPPAAAAAPRIVMVGRLVAQKNPLLFVRAAAALRRRLPAAQFQLIGDGPLRGAVADAARAAGLEGCLTLAGERRDVPELLRAADLFWLTSDWEGLPNAVIEAMASGLPVVATDVGGTGELIDAGVEGWVVAAGDCEALVARSLDVLGEPERLARMRAAARRRAERYGMAQMVGAMQQVYRRVAGLEAA